MIFKNECKRIMRPIILIFLIVVSVLWYFVYMRDCHSSLRNNDGMPYAVAKEYVQRFGTTIDADEIEEIKKEHQAALSELNGIFKQYMGEYGINTKEEYYDYNDKYYDTFVDKSSEDYRNALSKWGEEEYNRRAEIYDKLQSIYWEQNSPVLSASFKEQAIRDYIEKYDFLLRERKAYKADPYDEEWFFDSATAQQRRVLENRFSKDEISVYSGDTMNFDTYSSSWSLLIFICCAIAVIPMLVRNKMNNVASLQYASKQGKHILWKQFAAALSAGLLISVILIFVFQLFYLKEYMDFINCSINLGVGDVLFWTDFTLWEYMVFLWVKTILLVICEITALFWVSYYGKNYVTALALSVPVIVVFNLLCDKLNDFLWAFSPSGYPPFLYPFVIGVTMVITVILLVILMHKAKKADYLG